MYSFGLNRVASRVRFARFKWLPDARCLSSLFIPVDKPVGVRSAQVTSRVKALFGSKVKAGRSVHSSIVLAAIFRPVCTTPSFNCLSDPFPRPSRDPGPTSIGRSRHSHGTSDKNHAVLIATQAVCNFSSVRFGLEHRGFRGGSPVESRREAK